MKVYSTVTLFTALSAVVSPALAGDYDRSVAIVFPSGHLRTEHVSPYPMSRRAAAVWRSDACWRDCTGRNSWRFEARLRPIGPEASRAALDVEDRICQSDCRRKGGPLIGLLE